MATVFTETLGQVTDGKFAPVTTGTYYLRVSPFSSNTYTGTHLGSGVWSFGDVADGLYQLWNASAQVTNWGTKSIYNNETLIYVDLVSNQTMAGVKKFSLHPELAIAYEAPTTDNQYSPKKYVNDQDALTLDLAGTRAMTGALNMGTHKINGVVAGTAATDAVNLQQLQDATAIRQYHAIMAESGGVVTPTVWKNTTGATISVSRIATGQFDIVATTGVFEIDTVSYTGCMIQERSDGSGPTVAHNFVVSHADSRTISVYVFDKDNAAADFFDVEVIINCYSAP